MPPSGPPPASARPMPARLLRGGPGKSCMVLLIGVGEAPPVLRRASFPGSVVRIASRSRAMVAENYFARFAVRVERVVRVLAVVRDPRFAPFFPVALRAGAFGDIAGSVTCG